MGFIDKMSNKYQTGGLQHLLASQVRNEVGDEVFNEYFKFTFVRNPYSRCISQFNYMKSRPDLREYIGMSEDCTFFNYLNLIQEKEHVQWMPQYRFLYDSDSNLLVDYVGKLETFENSLAFVLKAINFRTHIFGLKTYRLPHKNKSKSSLSTDLITPESLDLVRNMYSKDFHYFGYDPDDVSILKLNEV